MGKGHVYVLANNVNINQKLRCYLRISFGGKNDLLNISVPHHASNQYRVLKKAQHRNHLPQMEKLPLSMCTIGFPLWLAGDVKNNEKKKHKKKEYLKLLNKIKRSKEKKYKVFADSVIFVTFPSSA